MAYTTNCEGIIEGNLSVINYCLSCYDTLDDPDSYYDRDELLHNRSTLEFARDRLSDRQRAQLDKVDAHWRSNPKDFNFCFGDFHYWTNRKTVLTVWVTDDQGRTPEIPPEHWWWKPLPEDAQK